MLGSFFKIVRWPNLVIVGGIQAIVFYTLIQYTRSVMDTLDVVLLILVTLIITAAGNVINDYYDSEIDRINKPHRWIAGNQWSNKTVLRLYKALFLAGGILSFWFALRNNLLLYYPVYVLSIVGLQFYSAHLKCRPVVGNLTVALYCGAVVLIMAIPDLIFHNPVIRPEFWFYILFAFLITYYREMVKDMEDVTGDKECGCQTLAVKAGLPSAKMVAVIFGVIALISVWFWENTQAVRLVSFGLMIIQGAVLGSIGFVIYAKSAKYFHHASLIIKLVMVAGTLLLFLQY